MEGAPLGMPLEMSEQANKTTKMSELNEVSEAIMTLSETAKRLLKVVDKY